MTFQPSGRSVFVLPGTNMLEAAGLAGLVLETPCGGAGTCGKCRLQVTTGAGEPTAIEKETLSETELGQGWRLACQTHVHTETLAMVPPTSLYASQQRILTETRERTDAEILPAVRKVYVELDPPTLSDPHADLARLEQRLGPCKTDLEMTRRLPKLLRECSYKGTAVLADHWLIDFEPNDTSGSCYGIAFDIGTTTLVAGLLDLCTGEELALVARVNPQVGFGDDVLSRIEYASRSVENLRELRRCIAGAVSEMIDELCTSASVPRRCVYEVVFAGNTTMQHLLCGLDVSGLGVVPFVPTHAQGLMLSASELGVNIHDRGRTYVFPLIGGFVGGDTVAGMLSADLADTEGAVLRVDIGTNGEIVLAHAGKLWAASAAAGPAFEGARISCGMRAVPGAIEKVAFDDDIELSVIGSVEPAGVCGSGLIDLAAGLLDAGIVTTAGRLLRADELPASVRAPLRGRVRSGAGGGSEFVLSERGGGPGGPLTITHRDVRELQLATGAIRAGIRILLHQAGVSPSDLQCVLIAGGFGSFIRRNHAQRIGLLPTEIDHCRLHYVGNTSLSGAKWALLSTRARERAEDLARSTEHVQLSEDPDFQDEFAQAMIFPLGD